MNEQLIKDLYSTGAHNGYSRTKRHPSVTPYLYGTRNRSDIINLEKTAAQIDRAIVFLKEVTAAGGEILFVGTKPEAKKLIMEGSLTIDRPYVEQRWIGGTLTNFPEINKRISTMNELLKKQALGELIYKTKKEKLMLERKIAKLQRMFSGLRDFSGKPKALIVIDPKKEHIAVDEARKRNIPIVALANTDCDLSLVQYPIVANDSSRDTIDLFLKQILATCTK
ncbi:MAG: small subunit ribosomal protein S2 [Planctomycetota bacterium]|jgi:small subunit ribosomal protein S2